MIPRYRSTLFQFAWTILPWVLVVSSARADQPISVITSATVPGSREILRESAVSRSLKLPSRMHEEEFPAVGREKMKIIFFHGHADQILNHRAFFALLQAQGITVTGFDFPQHGKSQLGALDFYSFADLVDLAFEEIRLVESKSKTPVAVMGWSFGGLVLTRTLQVYSARPDGQMMLDRLAGAVLLVPAIVPQLMTGGDGTIRAETLTQNTDLSGIAPPSFRSVLETPLFAFRLLYAAHVASRASFPDRFPTLVALSDPAEDLYVDVPAVEKYFSSQNTSSRQHPFSFLRCEHARHGLTYEPEPYRNEIAQWILRFLKVSDSPKNSAPSTEALCSFTSK